MSLCQTLVWRKITINLKKQQPCHRDAHRYKILGPGYTIESSLCSQHLDETKAKNPAARFQDLGA